MVKMGVGKPGPSPPASGTTDSDGEYTEVKISLELKDQQGLGCSICKVSFKRIRTHFVSKRLQMFYLTIYNLKLAITWMYSIFELYFFVPGGPNKIL